MTQTRNTTETILTSAEMSGLCVIIMILSPDEQLSHPFCDVRLLILLSSVAGRSVRTTFCTNLLILSIPKPQGPVNGPSHLACKISEEEWKSPAIKETRDTWFNLNTWGNRSDFKMVSPGRYSHCGYLFFTWKVEQIVADREMYNIWLPLHTTDKTHGEEDVNVISYRNVWAQITPSPTLERWMRECVTEASQPAQMEQQPVNTCLPPASSSDPPSHINTTQCAENPVWTFFSVLRG